MKKLLIVIEKPMEIQPSRNDLINEFVNKQKKQGYQIDIIGDSTGIMYDLLEENEVRTKEITGAQADVMFDLNRYEHAIYVPKDANANQDILVYDPEKLDKNMIFYNIGNLNISSKKALDKTREENKEALSGFTTEAGDYTDNIDKAATPEGVIGDEYDKSRSKRVDEIGDIFNKSAEAIEQDIIQSEQGRLQELQSRQQNTQEKDNYVADGCAIDPSEETLEKTREENKEVLSGFTTEAGDYTDNIDKAATPEGVIGDEYDKSRTERIEEIRDIFNQPEDAIAESMQSAEQGSIESIPKVSLDEKITLGEPSDKKKTNSVDDSLPSQELSENQNETLKKTENDTAKVKLSPMRKLWLVVPWVVMALMSVLEYQSIALAVFVLSLIALILAFLNKSQKNISKMPEVLSLLLAAVATAIEVVQPNWIIHVSLILSILGIILFIVIGNMKWED